MFRIQSNVPATPSVTQQLSGMKFDARQAAARSSASPGARDQMHIVGGPTPVEQRRSDVGSMRQTNHSVASASTAAQIVENGIEGARAILQQLFQVTQRAQDPEMSDGDRRQLQSEVRHLRQELNEMSQTARFSGIPLLNGAQRALTFQLGSSSEGGAAHLALTDVRPETTVPGVDGQSVSTPDSSQAASAVVREAIAGLDARLEKIGGFRERLHVVADDGSSHPSSAESGVAAIRATEDAVAMLTKARQAMMSSPTTSLLAQVSLISQEAMALIRP